MSFHFFLLFCDCKGTNKISQQKTVVFCCEIYNLLIFKYCLFLSFLNCLFFILLFCNILIFSYELSLFYGLFLPNFLKINHYIFFAFLSIEICSHHFLSFFFDPPNSEKCTYFLGFAFKSMTSALTFPIVVFILS